MFVQVITIRVPMGTMKSFRSLIDAGYLAVACGQPGFVRGYLLEQVDDPDQAQLVQVWAIQPALENFRKSGTMDQLFQDLHRALPGLSVQSQSYDLIAPTQTYAASNCANVTFSKLI